MLIQRGNKVRNLHEKKALPEINAKPQRPLQNSTSNAEGIFDEKQKINADLDISRYPFFQYIISILLFFFSLYAGASLAGIPYGLPGFDKKQWWQFCLVFLIFAFSMGMLFNSDCQRLVILKKRDRIVHETSKFFCLFREIEEKKISNITKVEIIVAGASSKVSLHSRWFGNQISFTDYSRLIVLRCISEENAQRYREMIFEILFKNSPKVHPILE